MEEWKVLVTLLCECLADVVTLDEVEVNENEFSFLTHVSGGWAGFVVTRVDDEVLPYIDVTVWFLCEPTQHFTIDELELTDHQFIERITAELEWGKWGMVMEEGTRLPILERIEHFDHEIKISHDDQFHARLLTAIGQLYYEAQQIMPMVAVLCAKERHQYAFSTPAVEQGNG